VGKVHWDWYVTRRQVLVTTFCSKHLLLVHRGNVFSAVLVGVVFGTCFFIGFVYLQTCTDLISYASSCLPPHPSKVQCIGASLYRQWSVISEPEHTKAIIRLVKSHHQTNVKLQYRFS